jgi:hypothetical protein
MLAAGRTNGEISEELGVSLAGAKWHVSEIMSKLGRSRGKKPRSTGAATTGCSLASRACSGTGRGHSASGLPEVWESWFWAA